jgi:hypothetical protein
MAKGRNRYRRPARRAPFRDPKPIILIVCEGENTEPQYLRGLLRACQNPRVAIQIAPETGVPKTLVETAKQRKKRAETEAKREKDANIAFDAVWCIFDVDEHPHVNETLQLARDAGIDIALSNPCFELWLLLQFRDNPGMQHRTRIFEMLREFDRGYDKSVDYATYSSGYQQAVTRARRMDMGAKKDGDIGRNPTTSVYRLTECILAD